jgi:hypothetical protein
VTAAAWSVFAGAVLLFAVALGAESSALAIWAWLAGLAALSWLAADEIRVYRRARQCERDAWVPTARAVTDARRRRLGLAPRRDHLGPRR